MVKFTVWLENKYNDIIQDAILGTVGGGAELNIKEKEHFLQRNTNEFSKEILNKIINLGVVRSIEDVDPNKFIDIKNNINRGVMIKDLIDQIRGENLAPNAAIKI
jgi:hypothetical protein